MAASSSATVFPDPDGPRLFGPGNIPTADVLVRLEATFRTVLHVTIPAVYKGHSGRYVQADTARKNVLTTRIFQDLRRGKLPSADDYWAITAGPYKDLIGADKARMDSWTNKNCPDVRKKGTMSKELRQTVLQWAATSGHQYGVRSGGRGGRPKSYKFDWGPAVGLTLSQLARTHTTLGTWDCGGAVIRWMGSATFQWNFPGHLQLFTELMELERDAYIMNSSTRGVQGVMN